MQFKLDTAQTYIPDELPVPDALERTTHMGIGAHQDDLEIMAIDGILKCFQSSDRWFTGVIVTNGSGSPRDGMYANYTDEEMMTVRAKEQKKAAVVGEYGAQVLLDYPSSTLKDGANHDPVEDIAQLLKASHPEVVYTHNLADKHTTHVALAVRVIDAIRSLPENERPQNLYGCEVWRDLDWLMDTDKVAFDVSDKEGIQTALVSVFDSQVSGGKRYNLATMGRRRAHATYHVSHGVDTTTGNVFGTNLTPLIKDPTLDIQGYIQERIARFAEDVRERVSSVL